MARLNMVLTPGILALYKCAYILTYLISLVYPLKHFNTCGDIVRNKTTNS